ncbi:MAG: ABC transporter permease [Candidatus Kaiserbacteria bacterium]|nr:ABC transporter permease [Candidatus Kaiserbacteria bacterium]
MKTADLFQETYAALSANKARSGLTILGIVIGISSVIAMISIGTGAQKSIQGSIEGLGTNLLTILPGVVQPGRGIVSSGRGSAETLKPADVDAITRIDGVDSVSAEVSRRFQVVADSGNNTNTTVTGASDVYAAIHNLDLAEGQFLSAENVRSLGRQAVLGATAATDLFGDNDPVGGTVRINGTLFHVIGVLKAKGGVGFSGPDDMVIVPVTSMQKILTGSDSYSTITVKVTDKNEMNDVQSEITTTLSDLHHVSEPDFSVISQQDILGTLTSVIQTFTLFLASIAGISLLVGGIGIMNMMLTTVTERTREIGLRKAIGARASDISRQFLVEAVTLTLVGGAVGVLLGCALALAVNFSGIVTTSISLGSVLLAFSVAAGIGIVFGYYPARRAARMNPIDALRYE